MNKEAKIEEQIEVPPQQLPPELENEEDEKVDEELQKEMKKVKIDESIFSNQEKKNQKEKKEKEEKKNKKKGIDFMDYANENNIQINIQYEEDKYKYPNKKNYDKNYHKNDKYNNHNNHYNRNNNNYNNNNNRRRQGKFNKGGFKKQNKFIKFGGNKFDAINMNNNNLIFNQNNYNQIPELKEDKDILTYLENIFNENNLNKDLYIRYRINENGQILINDLLNYNSLKKNNITQEKIIELIKDNQNLEYQEIDNKGYIIIKNFKNMNLNTIEKIKSNKKAYKMQRMQQNMFQNMIFNPYMASNYIYMENNFFIPSQILYPQQQNQNNVVQDNQNK